MRVKPPSRNPTPVKAASPRFYQSPRTYSAAHDSQQIDTPLRNVADFKAPFPVLKDTPRPFKSSSFIPSSPSPLGTTFAQQMTAGSMLAVNDYQPVWPQGRKSTTVTQNIAVAQTKSAEVQVDAGFKEQFVSYQETVVNVAEVV
jgi:hypothetical protein